MKTNKLMDGKNRRGFTTKAEDAKLFHFASSDLVNKLQTISPKTRTSSAKILGQRKCLQAVNPLCAQLKKEDKLYTKIAICEALENIGEASVSTLIKLLGEIGNNQHEQLPHKYFDKWNYPCPRDIVARTLSNIGKPALPYLMNTLEKGKISQISEAIDAIGKISFYSGDSTALSALKTCLLEYSDNEIIVWKIIRALEAFSSDDSIQILGQYLKSSEQKMFQWEAARSLAQVGGEKSREILNKALKTEKDQRTRKVLRKAIEKNNERHNV